MWCRCETSALVMPVAASLESLRSGSSPNSGQSIRRCPAKAAPAAGMAAEEALGAELADCARPPHAATNAQAHDASARRGRPRGRRRIAIGRCSSASTQPWGRYPEPRASSTRGGAHTDQEGCGMARTPAVGEEAPDFELEGTGGTFRLSDHRGERVVLLFYPGDNTPTCTAQFCSYRDRAEDFSALGAAVVG